MRLIRMALFLSAVILPMIGPDTVGADDTPRVRLETSLGSVVLVLERQKAPATVENFLGYVNDGFYDGTIFHRVIDGFMIQGGGFSADLSRKATRAPIKNEADNGLENKRGTIAMARTRDPHSATAQFFINVVDNGFLDHKAPTGRGWGYAVFGQVVEGMEVVDKIRAQPTGVQAGMRDVPVTAITIERAVVETP
ncbi:MAG: peptidyl-prolyl cis-trans isomerase [Gammaproteobacteria bacterium]|nr:peptidyl-prolyl cis-trans isomerase [Gammaproteobacteria bacterium]NIP87983.1 peptidyl-prolyl cis-trans isomerase [Gammaproteobacteria bacterium]NIR22141.1 peptidyl-prolyl cis-trans isomerase [Gammaproteobacteria bacterium]NIS03823.1 peptidyl-prolyl cis-trans isomerase [Gammaproteobacteria bacterium]NIU42263.1 peptidyl-prolyl cis-trans isomerase [Gammaproteobacteria bacterium]